jgi:integrase
MTLSGERVNIPGLGTYFRRRTDRPGYYAIEYYVDGVARRDSVARILRKRPEDTTEADARRCLKERRRQHLRGDLVTPAGERLTVAALFERYIESRILEGVKAPKDMRHHANRFLVSLGHVPAAKLTTEQIQAWAIAMIEKGWGRSTLSTSLRYLRATLRYGCQKARLIPTIPYVPTAGESPARQGYVGPAEFPKVVAHAPSPLLGLCWEFFYECGWRPGEARGLRWESVDWSQGAVKLPDSKGGARSLPIVGRIQEILEAARAARAVRFKNGRTLLSPWVFHGQEGGWISDRIFYAAWHAATAAAGLPGRPIPHDARRAFTTDATAAKVDRKSVMLTQGHKTEVMSVQRRRARPGRRASRGDGGLAEGASGSGPRQNPDTAGRLSRCVTKRP